MLGVFITESDSQHEKLFSAMDSIFRDMTEKAARGECAWCCSDCCSYFPEGMPDKCVHGCQRCTDIIQRDKLNSDSTYKSSLIEYASVVIQDKVSHDWNPIDNVEHAFQLYVELSNKYTVTIGEYDSKKRMQTWNDDDEHYYVALNSILNTPEAIRLAITSIAAQIGQTILNNIK